jgi:hypothetical protein
MTREQPDFIADILWDYAGDDALADPSSRHATSAASVAEYFADALAATSPDFDREAFLRRACRGWPLPEMVWSPPARIALRAGLDRTPIRRVAHKLTGMGEERTGAVRGCN